MKFLIDAQLPQRLARQLSLAGHDVIHTSDLPDRNKSPDATVIAVAINQERVVVTKDQDFVTHFVLNGAPPKLLLISTGNIGNEKLWNIIASNLGSLVAALNNNDFVELNSGSITIHR